MRAVPQGAFCLPNARPLFIYRTRPAPCLVCKVQVFEFGGICKARPLSSTTLVLPRGGKIMHPL